MNKSAGRKIKRGHGLYGNRKKKRTKGIVAIILTVVAAGALVFLGYSIGEPIMNFFKNLNANSDATDPWTPPVSESQPIETDDMSSSSSTEAPEQSPVSGSSIMLSDDALLSSDALKKAVETAKADGYTTVILPMKLQGGRLNYRSTVEMAVNAEVSAENGMTASEIAGIVKASGIKAIAKISVLNDNIVPKMYKSTGYTFEDGATQWLDNRPDNGGKPWISPFSEKARGYISDIAKEIDSAAFDGILCSDVSFPTFRKKDLGYIGEIVKSPDRYKALVNVLNIFTEGKTPVLLQVSDMSVLDGTEEILHPEELSGVTAVIYCKLAGWNGSVKIGEEEVALDDMKVSEKTALIFNELKNRTGDMNVTPCVDSESLTEGELNEILTALNGMGYKSVMIE